MKTKMDEIGEELDDFLDGYQYHLTRDKSGFEVGTVTLDDFTEIDFEDEWWDEIKSFIKSKIIEVLEEAKGKEKDICDISTEKGACRNQGYQQKRSEIQDLIDKYRV